MKQFLLAIVFLSCIHSVASQEKQFPLVAYPKNYIAQIDVVYTEVNDWVGKMDLYTIPNATRRTPVVINIHGGGWKSGSKESQTGFKTFFKHGYALVNVAYRLADEAPAPAAIEDVRCALVYVHKNAKALNIDTSKIVIMGGSAGGHLALMAGLLGNDKRFDTNCESSENIKVAAIIDKYGVTDLAPLAFSKSPRNWLSLNNIDNVFVELVSPINYVSFQSPPVFIAHGNEDPIVPYQQSVILYNKLKANGVKTEFLTIKNGKHGHFTKKQNILLSKSIWNFLNSLDL